MARNKKNQPAAMRFGPAFKAFLLCLLIGGSGVGYVWQQDQIDRLSGQIRKRELRLDQLVEENKNRKEQLATMRSPPFLELRIKELNLGLAPAQPTQIWVLNEPSHELPKARDPQFAGEDASPATGPKTNEQVKRFMPPPATPSDEEPIAVGARHVEHSKLYRVLDGAKGFLPPPVMRSDEEPIPTGGRRL
jgi:hypothetical protein